MKKLVTLAIGLAIAGPAMGADIKLYTKAAPLAFPFDASGWYLGMGTVAATTKADLSVPALGSSNVTTVGAGVGPVAGYFSGTAASFKAVQCGVYYQNLGGTQIGLDTTANSNISGSCDVMLGGTMLFTNLMGLLPLNPGGVFTGIGPVGGPNSLPFASIGFNIEKPQLSVLGVTSNNWQVQPTIGMGFFTRVVDVMGKDTGYATKTTIKYSPAMKGDSIMVDGTANMGRRFMAEFAVVK